MRCCWSRRTCRLLHSHAHAACVQELPPDFEEDGQSVIVNIDNGSVSIAICSGAMRNPSGDEIGERDITVPGARVRLLVIPRVEACAAAYASVKLQTLSALPLSWTRMSGRWGRGPARARTGAPLVWAHHERVRLTQVLSTSHTPCYEPTAAQRAAANAIMARLRLFRDGMLERVLGANVTPLTVRAARVRCWLGGGVRH